jgi:hypothetical protein
MSRQKYIGAYCGHTSTEQYLANQPLGCCAKCAKKMGKAGIEQAIEQLAAIRRALSVHCPDCNEAVAPLEGAGVLLGVYWGQLDVVKAKELTLNAHARHQHTIYDEERRKLEEQGYDSDEARRLVRYGRL